MVNVSSILTVTSNIKLLTMIITIKSKDGYNVDVTSIYLKALQGKITPDEYKSQLKKITLTNKNI